MLKYILYIISCVLLCSSCTQNKKSLRAPNVLIVLTDDQGYGDVGYNGNEMIRTPMLDSIAGQSIVFDKFYVSPVCAPTRASILTGKYHLATGTSWVTHRKEVMRESEITLAEILKGNGYQTAYFGKWHNGAQFPHNPLGQGFDTFFGFCAGHWNNYFNAKLSYNNTTVQTKGYITDVLTDSVVSFIKQEEEPFFAMVAYNTPHTPYQVSDEYFNYYQDLGLDAKTSSIYGMCENVDDNLSRIYLSLEENGQLENTILIFLSDNGPNFVRYNGGLKGRKGHVDEGGVRVPFVFHYPKAGLASRVIEHSFACHIDLVPTLLDFCGIDNQKYSFDGISLKETICNSDAKPIVRDFYSHQISSEDQFCSSVRNEDYLLIMYPHDTALYNLSSDPYQRRNIYDKNKTLASTLSGEYAGWLKQVCRKGLEPEPIHLSNDINRTELPAHEAKLYGDLVFAGTIGWANDWVLGFNSQADSMVWDVVVDDKCRYSASVHYACSQQDVKHILRLDYKQGTLMEHVNKVVLADIVPNADRVKRNEVDERLWGEINLGEMDFMKDNQRISLSINTEGVSGIEIKDLTLRKVQ